MKAVEAAKFPIKVVIASGQVEMWPSLVSAEGGINNRHRIDLSLEDRGAFCAFRGRKRRRYGALIGK